MTGPPIPVTDPGFLRGGGANRKDGGANLLFFPIFPQNRMKMKKFTRGVGGRRPWRLPRSTNEYPCFEMLMPWDWKAQKTYFTFLHLKKISLCNEVEVYGRGEIYVTYEVCVLQTFREYKVQDIQVPQLTLLKSSWILPLRLCLPETVSKYMCVFGLKVRISVSALCIKISVQMHLSSQ